jgi:hypothetical protein
MSAEPGVGFLLLGIASRNRPSRFSFSITGGGPLFFGVSLSHAWRTRNRSVGTELRARPAPRSNSQDLAAAIRVRKGNPLPRHVPRPRQEYVGVVHGAATRAARIPSPPRMKERGGSEFVVRCGAWGCPRAAVSIPSAPHCQSGGAAPRSLLDVDGHGACVAVWAALPPGRQATCTAGSGRRAPRFQRDHDCLPTNRSSRDGCVDSTKTCADLYAWPSAGRDASCIMGGGVWRSEVERILHVWLKNERSETASKSKYSS